MIQTLTLRARYALRSELARRPELFRAIYARARKHADRLVGPRTSLVIEGFPRSANTYAVWAFRHDNPGANLAHHTHAQAQVIYAAKHRLPALVVIREPEAAVRSLLVRHPHIGAALALRSYAQFYEDLLPYRSGFVLGHFDQVVADFGAAIVELNAKFGTCFVPFVTNEENRKRVIDRIDAAHRGAYGAVRISHLPRPHEQRDSLKHAVDLRHAQRHLDRARAVFHRISATQA